jgi:hypothetical protein
MARGLKVTLQQSRLLDASALLRDIPFEKGFHFYVSLKNCTELTATNLLGFITRAISERRRLLIISVNFKIAKRK